MAVTGGRKPFEPRFAVTGIGSLPHVSPERAVSDVLSHCPEVPYWPQLPRLSPREDMYRQFSAGLPGLVPGDPSGPRWCRDQEAAERLERVYRDTLSAGRGEGGEGGEDGEDGEGGEDGWALRTEDAAGLEAFRRALAPPAFDLARWPGLLGLKGQSIGPVSLGLAVTDAGGRALLYEEDLMDGVARGLALRARWQERFLRGLLTELGGNGAGYVLISVDEPYLGTFGSAYFPYRPETVLGYLRVFDEVLDGVWGLHCCANTDWEFVLASPARFLSFDTWAYGDRLVLYPEAVAGFLAAGKVLVWGLVPTDATLLGDTDGPALHQRLLGHIETLVKKGVSERALAQQSMLSPACGLAGLAVEDARRAMSLVGAVSRSVRAEFGPGPAPGATGGAT